MLNDETDKKISIKKIDKKKLKSTGLTHQTRNMDHEIVITKKEKANHNKL
jgi:predicted metalloprotease